MIRIAGRRQACIHKVKKNGQGRPIERDRGYVGPTSCGAGVDQVRLTKTTGVCPPFPLKSIFYPLLVRQTRLPFPVAYRWDHLGSHLFVNLFLRSRRSEEEVEHNWVEGVLGFSLGGWWLMPWSSGKEFTLAARVDHRFLQEDRVG
ncbi:hypothetical protein BHM03_00004113 [Ensete ventricosum]|nr:hypothetical protein BHM03_00004113 [Ensete ventricosum]